MSFFLSAAGIGILIDFAIIYEIMNRIIIIPKPNPTLDDSTDWLLPINAESAPARTPRPTRNQNNLSSPLFTLDSSVCGGLGDGTPVSGLPAVSSTLDLSSSFFFGCRTN